MTGRIDPPVVRPTDTELSIWAHTRPARAGGLVRTKAHIFKDCVDWEDFYRSPDSLNPDDWESKVLAGFRGEWFAHVLEGCERVLDIGCGFGFPSLYLARRGHEVTGVDPSSSEIRTAREIASRMVPRPRVSFVNVGERELPFPDDSFDGSALSTSLECALEPATMLEEMKRVLRPGSPVAIQEEDRSLQPESHPVWEKLRWAFFDEAVLLWYEVRVQDPYLDRRYMLRMDADGRAVQRMRHLASRVLDRKDGLPVVDFADAGISLESALSDVSDGRWSQAQGFDPRTLRRLLAGAGLGDIRFWLLPDGKRLAHSLERNGLLPAMPADARQVLRSVLESMQTTDLPVSCVVSCRTL